MNDYNNNDFQYNNDPQNGSEQPFDRDPQYYGEQQFYNDPQFHYEQQFEDGQPFDSDSQYYYEQQYNNGPQFNNDPQFHYEQQAGSSPQGPNRNSGGSKARKRKKRGGVLKVLFCAVLGCAVVTSSTLSIIAIKQSRTQTAVPAATLTSQKSTTTQASSDGSFMLTDVSDIVSAAMPSVVSITSRSIVSNYGYEDIWDYFMHGGPQRNQRPEQEQEEVDSGIGSGTIIGSNDKELLILTSYHVVEDCSSMYVTFNDGASVDGYLKGANEDKDIAVVAVPLSDISKDTMNSIAIASLSEEEVEVGDGIVIIGNALGYGQSAITGIISATDRTLSDNENDPLRLLQTDAAINSGNSGGCMLNAKGEIVGISEAKIADASVEGMCYAIPIKENLDLIRSLMEAETTGQTV